MPMQLKDIGIGKKISFETEAASGSKEGLELSGRLVGQTIKAVALGEKRELLLITEDNVVLCLTPGIGSWTRLGALKDE